MTETRSVSEGPASHASTAAPCGVQLVCPRCHTVVTRCDDAWICESPDCRRRYPIIDDIPKFIIEEAEQLQPDDWKSLVTRVDSA